MSKDDIRVEEKIRAKNKRWMTHVTMLDQENIKAKIVTTKSRGWSRRMCHRKWGDDMTKEKSGTTRDRRRRWHDREEEGDDEESFGCCLIKSRRAWHSRTRQEDRREDFASCRTLFWERPSVALCSCQTRYVPRCALLSVCSLIEEVPGPVKSKKERRN